MRWKGRRQSANIEDRRQSRRPPVRLPRMGSGAGRRISLGRGRGGIGLIIVFVVVAMILGVNPLELLTQGQMGAPPNQVQMRAPDGSGGSLDNEMRDFVATVLAETEDTWSQIFAASGVQYSVPTLVLFSGSVGSACGFASAASGPFYCPGDKKIYIDLSFYDQLRRRFDAPGDFAQAYVLAHEVGHHVQNLTGVLPEYHRRRPSLSKTEANRMSVRVELQADCLAGIWARSVKDRGLLDPGDVEEALNAASQIGDDVLQKRAQGYVVPDAFNHGTSEQRRRWFGRGLEAKKLDDCDTF